LHSCQPRNRKGDFVLGATELAATTRLSSNDVNLKMLKKVADASSAHIIINAPGMARNDKVEWASSEIYGFLYSLLSKELKEHIDESAASATPAAATPAASAAHVVRYDISGNRW
jgi:hypothetical protein